MNLPEMTAEVSLYQSNRHYRAYAHAGFVRSSAGAVRVIYPADTGATGDTGGGGDSAVDGSNQNDGTPACPDGYVWDPDSSTCMQSEQIPVVGHLPTGFTDPFSGSPQEPVPPPPPKMPCDQVQVMAAAVCSQICSCTNAKGVLTKVPPCKYWNRAKGCCGYGLPTTCVTCAQYWCQVGFMADYNAANNSSCTLDIDQNNENVCGGCGNCGH